jgi:hypothetical protein
VGEFFELLVFWPVDRAIAKRGDSIRYQFAREGFQTFGYRYIGGRGR